MEPIPYTVEAFKEEYPLGFMTPFTHGTTAKGVTDEAYTRACVTHLNAGTTRASPAISFHPEMLTGPQLAGGACSAHAFRVGKEALKAQRRLSAQKLSEDTQEKSFLLELASCTNRLETMALSSTKEAKAEQMTIRSEQMALNTITIDRTRGLVWQCCERKDRRHGPLLRTEGCARNQRASHQR